MNGRRVIQGRPRGALRVVSALTLFCAAGLAEEPASGDPLTARLAELIRVSERQVEAGTPQKALETLADAKKLAAEARRPEAGLIEARIIRLQGALETAAATPAASREEDKPAAGENPAAGPGEAKPGEIPKEEKPKGVLLKLEDCVEIAVQNNLGLKISRLNDRASDLDLRNAWARYLPSFTVEANNSGGDTGARHSNTSTFSGRIDQKLPTGGTASVFGTDAETHPLSGSSRSASYGASLTHPLWKGAGLDVGLHDIRLSKLNKLISRGNLELDVQELVFLVRQAYANCVRQIQAREVNRKAVDSATKFLGLTQAQERAGKVTKLDIFNAEVQLADRELALTANERALENAFDTLKQIMDVDLEENVAVVEQPVEFGERPISAEEEKERKIIEIDEKTGTVTLNTYEVKRVVVKREEKVFEGGQEKTVTREEVRHELGNRSGQPLVMFQASRYQDQQILDQALAQRIQLLNSRRALAIDKLNALLTRNGLGQQIDVSAGYSRSGGGQKWPDALDHENNDYSLGLKYTVPWGKLTDHTAYERALLELGKAEVELKRTRTQVHLEVRDLLRALLETEKTTLIQGKKVEQAKRSAEAAQISFRSGLKDSFDVIRAEDNLFQAKTDFINRRLDYVVRVAELEKVVGKPTGRVDLNARQPGGLVEGALPPGLNARGLPRPAPTATPRPEDDPFEYEKARK